MKITSRTSSIRTIKSGDPHFHIVNDFVISPRAGFEINQHCPKEYRMILSECINNGWIKPVAHVTERELLFIGLAAK